jgi:prophage antirepressor-like protein
MENQVKVFESAEFGSVRTVEVNGEPYFVARDVATILAYAKPENAIATHVDGDDTLKQGIIDSLGRVQQTTLINESGLYSLILGSKLPNAKKFKRWVTSEVLPSIRKHGMYATDELLANPDFAIRVFQKLKEEQSKSKLLEVKVSELTVDKQIMQPKADYFDELVDRNLLTGIRDTANELGIGQKKFVNFLLDKKFMYRSKKGNLKAYANHIRDGLFENVECYNEKSTWKGTQYMITPKGRETFRLLTQGL